MFDKEKTSTRECKKPTGLIGMFNHLLEKSRMKSEKQVFYIENIWFI